MFSQPGMGYDRATTMFSPDGRLFQVEYAIEAVKKGSLILGMISKKDQAVVIAAEKKLLPLQEEHEVGSEKLWIIDDHAIAGISGLTADARTLIDLARVKAQVHKLSYDMPIGIQEIAREIGDQCQLYTQSAGARPYGVSLLIGGIDAKEGPKLYNTDPSGSFWGYFACAIGNAQINARQILEKKYSIEMTLDALLDLVIETFKGSLESTVEPKSFDIAYIKASDQKIVFLSMDDKKKLLDKK